MPKYFNWTITFYHLDKNPFGGKIFYELLQSRFDEVDYYFNTVYEMEDEIGENIIILAENFYPDDHDLEVLLSQVAQGSKALIASQNFSFNISDTLKLDYQLPFPDFDFLDPAKENADSLTIRMTNAHFQPGRKYVFPRQVGRVDFTRIDTLQARILAVNDQNYPVLVSYPVGDGELFICSTPLIFSNYALLLNDNYRLAESVLSYFGGQSVQWFQYYQMGRMESPSPMRYVLSELPLKWAFYTAVLAVVLFMFFEAKRKQRIIPVVEPLKNNTLNFTRVIGRLYHQKKDHRDLAWKKILYFHEFALRHYFIDVFKDDEHLAERLADKAGQPRERADKLLKMIAEVKKAGKISSSYLFELNKLIDKFYST